MPTLHRRTILAGVGSSIFLPNRALASSSPVRAIAFDAFPIFDPRSISALAVKMLGADGGKLVSQWSSKLFSYTWLETAADHYDSFQVIADRALRSAAENMNLSVSNEAVATLVAKYGELDVWPDVKAALFQLRRKGIRLRLLSNLGIDTLKANVKRNGLDEVLEQPLSTDLVKRFKPSPTAYAMAVDAFGLPKDRIGFAAFAGWDAIGATWFGYRTAWINRSNATLDPFATRPEIVSQGMGGVLALAGIA